MKINYCIFSHSVLLTSDGLFNLLGGGIQWITAPSFPAIIEHFCLLVNLAIEPNECGNPYQCVVKVADPDGNCLIPDLTVVVNASANKVNPSRPSSFTARFGYDRFTFTRPGAYRFSIVTGEQSLGEAIVDLGEVSQT